MAFSPRLNAFPDHPKRIALTLSCRDCDALPKVSDAGRFREVDGVTVQVMHNGVLVEKDAYCGAWITEIIRCLRGHHEPQEELIFSRMVERLLATEERPSMIELGSWWAYFSLWFRRALPRSHVVAMEPDQRFLEVGRRNFGFNRESATFIHGAIGPHPGETMRFLAESDGGFHDVPQYDVAALMSLGGLDRISLLLADIQGAETILIEQLRPLIARGCIRFLLISTHHHSISGDPMTHQKVLAEIQAGGGHVIAEHTVGESFSGDGLIAASFDPRDAEMVVKISLARQHDSLFGDLEPDLATAWARADRAEARRAKENAELCGQFEDFNRRLIETQVRLDAVEGSRVWRWSRTPSRLYHKVRRPTNNSQPER